MSIEDVGEVPGKAPVPWVRRSGVGGKLMAGGAALGVIAAFLPLATVSMQMMGMMGGSQTATVFDAWQGKATLAGSLACGAFAWLLYPPAGRPSRGLCWAAVGVGVVTGLLALWLLINATRTRGGADLMGMGSVSASMGIGAVVNLVAGVGMAVGALVKGREERLF
jgi:hypothetical protein